MSVIQRVTGIHAPSQHSVTVADVIRTTTPEQREQNQFCKYDYALFAGILIL